jgi:hypothetical protein
MGDTQPSQERWRWWALLVIAAAGAAGALAAVAVADALFPGESSSWAGYVIAVLVIGAFAVRSIRAYRAQRRERDT